MYEAYIYKSLEKVSNYRRAQEGEIDKPRRLAKEMGENNRLINSMPARTEREHDFNLIQFLSSHDCFREYLHKFRHYDGTECSFCSSAVHSRYEVKRSTRGQIINENMVFCTVFFFK